MCARPRGEAVRPITGRVAGLPAVFRCLSGSLTSFYNLDVPRAAVGWVGGFRNGFHDWSHCVLAPGLMLQ